jgi:RimJ/RimL family protein N-acetyltransferase
MGMIARLWSNRVINPVLTAMERVNVRLRETLVYAIDPKNVDFAISKNVEGLEFLIATKPLADWPLVISASSQVPGPNEREDIWINAIKEGRVVGTLAICFRSYFVEETCLRVHFPGGYIFGYFVVEDMRGEGVGKSMLLKAIEIMVTLEGGKRLFALVDNKNTSSKRTFDATGFRVEKRISSIMVAGRGLHKTHNVSSQANT